ncbi:MAG: protease pro-enzyme activation domain-containing protein [Candidatus Binataceae bacterium]
MAEPMSALTNQHPQVLCMASWASAPRDKQLRLEVVFNPLAEVSQQRIAHAREDLAYSSYRQVLTDGSDDEETAPAEQDFDEVVAWLRHQGFMVGFSRADDRNYVKFTGAVAQVERSFQIRIATDSDGRFGNVTDPMIPSRFANTIAYILGLEDMQTRRFGGPRMFAPPSTPYSVDSACAANG